MLGELLPALGGVPLKVVIDNLKAGVLKPDWYEPELNPKLAEQNRFLEQWEAHTADTRTHGTTRGQVGEHFRSVEAPTLAALPADLCPNFLEAPRKVHRDGHVEYRRTYYSVPPEYVGQKVWLRQETRLIRILNLRREQIALHTKAEQGRFVTDPNHLHSRKRCVIERGADFLLDQCRALGPHTGTWAKACFDTRAKPACG